MRIPLNLVAVAPPERVLPAPGYISLGHAGVFGKRRYAWASRQGLAQSTAPACRAVPLARVAGACRVPIRPDAAAGAPAHVHRDHDRGCSSFPADGLQPDSFHPAATIGMSRVLPWTADRFNAASTTSPWLRRGHGGHGRADPRVPVRPAAPRDPGRRGPGRGSACGHAVKAGPRSCCPPRCGVVGGFGS